MQVHIFLSPTNMPSMTMEKGVVPSFLDASSYPPTEFVEGGRRGEKLFCR